MRTCVLADIHGNLPALEAVLRSAAAEDVTRFVVLGDLVGYGPHPNECVERIAELPDCVAVQGGHDYAIATRSLLLSMDSLARQTAEWSMRTLCPAEREWLSGLPDEVGDADWLGVHGSAGGELECFAGFEGPADVPYLDALARRGKPLCFFGCTHMQGFFRWHNGRTDKAALSTKIVLGDEGRALLVNPGSVGLPRDGDARAAFAIWDHDAQEIRFLRAAYDVDRTIRDLRLQGLPEVLGSHLLEGKS